jgi:hypothetical protein
MSATAVRCTSNIVGISRLELLANNNNNNLHRVITLVTVDMKSWSRDRQREPCDRVQVARRGALEGAGFRAKDDVGRKTDGVEGLHQTLRGLGGGIFRLILDLHIAGQSRFHVAAGEGRLVHG